MTRLLIIKDFISRFRKDWNISNLFNSKELNEETFCDVLYCNKLNKFCGQKISYEEKFNLISELKENGLIIVKEVTTHSPDVVEEPKDASVQDNSELDSELDEIENNDNISSQIFQPIKIVFLRAAQSFKYPIYYVLNLNPIDPQDYPKGTLQECLESDRFDVGSFSWMFPAKFEPNKVLNSRPFSTAATIITRLISIPLMRIFPYLVPYDIIVQVATKFVLSYTNWTSAFKDYIKTCPDKTDLDLINWLAIKIKHRFATRAKDILIPLNLYPGKISDLDDLEDCKKLIKKHTPRKGIPKGKNQKNQKKGDSTQENEKTGKDPICPQYFDYKSAINNLHRLNEDFKSKKLSKRKSKSTEEARKDLDDIMEEPFIQTDATMDSLADVNSVTDLDDNSTTTTLAPKDKNCNKVRQIDSTKVDIDVRTKVTSHAGEAAAGRSGPASRPTSMAFSQSPGLLLCPDSVIKSTNSPLSKQMTSSAQSAQTTSKPLKSKSSIFIPKSVNQSSFQMPSYKQLPDHKTNNSSFAQDSDDSLEDDNLNILKNPKISYGLNSNSTYNFKPYPSLQLNTTTKPAPSLDLIKRSNNKDGHTISHNSHSTSQTLSKTFTSISPNIKATTDPEITVATQVPSPVCQLPTRYTNGKRSFTQHSSNDNSLNKDNVNTNRKTNLASTKSNSTSTSQNNDNKPSLSFQSSITTKPTHNEIRATIEYSILNGIQKGLPRSNTVDLRKNLDLSQNCIVLNNLPSTSNEHILDLSKPLTPKVKPIENNSIQYAPKMSSKRKQSELALSSASQPEKTQSKAIPVTNKKLNTRRSTRK